MVTTVARAPSFRLLDVGADDLVAERRRLKEEQDAAAEAAAPGETTEESEIIGDKQSKTYYPNGCQPAKEIAEANRVMFKTAAEAEKAGFKAAKNCH
jgi:hypothetical protein